MPWSKQQQRTINTYDKNILVAAAAGSGHHPGTFCGLYAFLHRT